MESSVRPRHTLDHGDEEPMANGRARSSDHCAALTLRANALRQHTETCTAACTQTNNSTRSWNEYNFFPLRWTQRPERFAHRARPLSFQPPPMLRLRSTACSRITAHTPSKHPTVLVRVDLRAQHHGSCSNCGGSVLTTTAFAMVWLMLHPSGRVLTSAAFAMEPAAPSLWGRS
jgi:hypothetical protein